LEGGEGRGAGRRGGRGGVGGVGGGRGAEEWSGWDYGIVEGGKGAVFGEHGRGGEARGSVGS